MLVSTVRPYADPVSAYAAHSLWEGGKERATLTGSKQSPAAPGEYGSLHQVMSTLSRNDESVELNDGPAPLNLLSTALDLVAQGFRVLPLEPGDKNPARSLVKHGYLSATNRYSVITRWWEQGQQWNLGMVPPPGVVVLDVDPRKGGDRTLARMIEEGYLPRTITDTTLTTTTGRGDGGVHIYLGWPGPTPSSGAALGPGIDIRHSENGYLVAPGSLHPEGGYYTSNWATIAPAPPPLIAKLAPARTPPPKSPPTQLPPTLAGSTLRPQWQSMLQTGLKEYGDTTPSGVEWSILLSGLHAGWSVEAFLAAAADPLNRGLYEYAQREGRNHLRAEYDRATAFLLSDDSPTLHLIGQLRTLAASAPWPGVRGTYDRLALAEILRVAAKHDRTTVSFSLRQMQEAIGCSTPTIAGRSLRRLTAAKWIERVGRGTLTEGSTYRLSTALVTDPATPLTHHEWCAPPEGDPEGELDAFAFRGLGRSAQLVYRALRSLPGSTQSQLKTLTGKSQPTISRALRLLREHSLAATTERAWHPLEGDLTRVAKALNTAGQAAQRRAINKLDRLAWQQRCNQERAERDRERRIEWLLRTNPDLQLDPFTGEVINLITGEVVVAALVAGSVSGVESAGTHPSAGVGGVSTTVGRSTLTSLVALPLPESPSRVEGREAGVFPVNNAASRVLVSTGLAPP